MLNYGEMLEHLRAKQVMACLYLYHMAIGNCQKDLILIPFMVKHITKCLCFRLKKTYKFSMVTIIFVNENPSMKFSRKRLRDRQRSRNIMSLWSFIKNTYTIPRIKRCDNRPLSNFANTKEQS